MAMLNQTNQSCAGLKVRNRNDININFFCELCKLLLVSPMQLLCCGTRLCRWCSSNGLSNSEPFICPFCKLKQLKMQAYIDRGIELELNMVKIGCYACYWNGLFKDYKEHLQQPHADLTCNDCHERFSEINPYEEHRQTICEYRCIPCALPGCSERVKWSEMEIHYLSDKHQNLLLEFTTKYKFLTKTLSCNNHSTTSLGHINNTEKESIAVQESNHILPPAPETLLNNGAELRSKHDQINATRELTAFGLNEVKVLDADNTTAFYFKKQYDEMESSFSFYSSTFKTSTYGYLFKLRISSTIQSGNENQKYLSVYITLLRGEFDAILVYPFPYNIYIYLCDQSGQGKHVVSMLKSDRNSPSFALPTSEMNPEIGIMKFCPLNFLTNAIYLKDGVFFIRVFIDLMNNGSNPFKSIDETTNTNCT